MNFEHKTSILIGDLKGDENLFHALQREAASRKGHFTYYTINRKRWILSLRQMKQVFFRFLRRLLGYATN